MHISLLVLLPLLAEFVRAQGGATCSSTKLCSSSAPCCSEFGFCGDDYFCLGGCNPLASATLDACRPNPVCQDAKYVFTDNSRVLSNSTQFDGNATAYDWVVDKGNIMNSGGALVMLLTEDNGGTRISSTRYVHYGTITATIQTGHWDGVVTAFITMSDIKDEIDWEFPGNKVTEGQSNFFWQGVIPPTTAGATHSGLTDTSANYHDFTIDWQPDALTFQIDGKPVRTVKKTDDHYPNTPSRIQLSLWPAGIKGSPPGTVAWSGGMINWQDPDYVSAGHFYASVKQVTVKCADPKKPGVNITSYVYGPNSTANTPGVAFSNHSTLLNGAETLLVNSAGRGLLAAVVGVLLGAHLFV